MYTSDMSTPTRTNPFTEPIGDMDFSSSNRGYSHFADDVPMLSDIYSPDSRKKIVSFYTHT